MVVAVSCSVATFLQKEEMRSFLLLVHVVLDEIVNGSILSQFLPYKMHWKVFLGFLLTDTFIQ